MSGVEKWKCDWCGVEHHKDENCERYIVEQQSTILENVENLDIDVDDGFDFDSANCLVKFMNKFANVGEGEQ